MNNPTMIRSIGQVADDAANVATELPLKVGAVANDAVSAVADGDKVHLVTDLTRQLRTHPVGGVADNAANVAAEYPIKVGGVGIADPTGAVVTDGDVAHIATDLMRRLWTHPIGPVKDNDGASTEAPIRVGATADAALTLVTNANVVDLVTDLYRRLRVCAEGEAAHDAAISGNPVPMGAKAVTTLETPDQNDVTYLTTDLFARLRTLPSGAVADGDADTSTMYPLKVGAVAETTPAGTGVANADAVHLITDLYRRLWTHPVGAVADDAANVTTEYPVKVGAVAYDALDLAQDQDMVHLATDLYRRLLTRAGVESAYASWVDSNSVEADAYYPSEEGFDATVYRTITLTGKIITGAQNTSVMTIQVSNDEDATPASRDWITIYYYRNDLDANEASLAVGANTTQTFAISLDNLGVRRVRAYYNISVGVTDKDTVIIKGRYTA